MGGKSSSSSSASTSQTTTAQQDKRIVNDGGGNVFSLDGDGRVGFTVNNTTNATSAEALTGALTIANSAIENSARLASGAIISSQNGAMQSVIAAEREAKMAIDSANRSAIAATDQAKASADLAGKISAGAWGFGGDVMDRAATLLQRHDQNAMDFNMAGTRAAYDTFAEALGFAGHALDMTGQAAKEMPALVDKVNTATQDAYAKAASIGTGQQVLVIAALAGVVIVAIAMTKGK